MFFIFGGYVKSPKGKKKIKSHKDTDSYLCGLFIVKNNFSLNGGMRIKLYYLQGRFIILLFLFATLRQYPTFADLRY